MINKISIKTVLFFVAILFIVILAIQISIHRAQLEDTASMLIEYRRASLIPVPQPTMTPLPSQPPLPTTTTTEFLDDQIYETPGQSHVPQIIYTEEDAALPWGVAQKVDDVTYTIKVGYDEEMGSSQEILDALNQYRSVHGISALVIDDKLALYAQSRADYFQQTGNTDKHVGFDDYLQNEDGFNVLKYRRLGENSFYGGSLAGPHLIEWVFAQSPGHDANQLDSAWTHVGIGTTSVSVDIIFGSGQI